jgi:hypothetical protein
VFDSEPEIDENVENDQVRLINRNRVDLFEHLRFSNLFSYPIFFICNEIMWASGFEYGPVSFKKLGAHMTSRFPNVGRNTVLFLCTK